MIVSWLSVVEGRTDEFEKRCQGHVRGAPRDWLGWSFAGLTDHLSFNIPHSYEDLNAKQWTQPLTFSWMSHGTAIVVLVITTCNFWCKTWSSVQPLHCTIHQYPTSSCPAMFTSEIFAPADHKRISGSCLVYEIDTLSIAWWSATYFSIWSQICTLCCQA